jgi:CheY-like chemotaxis protein
MIQCVHQLIGDALPIDYAMDVTHASNGIECLNVDLAFIDVHMPTMGGMDALWAARIAGNKTFVTLMSGAANRRCIDLARQLDAYEFLTKPFGRPEIDSILTTHRRVTASMRVLLVDDSRVSLKVMRKVLGSSIFHLNIKEVCTGVAAVARFNFERLTSPQFDAEAWSKSKPLGHFVRIPRRFGNPFTPVISASHRRR